MKVVLVCTLALSATGFLDETFERAGVACENRDYAMAATLYEQLVAEGVVEPVVFFNLGNAYYRAGRLGPAIANYERALRLNPQFDDARQNLEYCVRQTRLRMARPSPPDWRLGLFFWHYELGPHATQVIAVLSWGLCWALLALREWRPFPYLRRAALALGVVGALFGTSAYVKAHPADWAVVSVSDARAYYGKSEEEKVRFELSEGDRVTVDRREDGWARVVTEGGERGWVSDGILTFVGPPYERAPSEQASTEAAPAQAP